MAFLDFIKNRDGQRPAGEQQSQQKTETYRDANIRRDAEDKANAKPVTSISNAAKAEAQEIRQSYQQATQPGRADAPASTPAPGSGGSPEASRQKTSGQDKSAPALSPTDANAGKTVADERASQPQKEESPSQQPPSQQVMQAAGAAAGPAGAQSRAGHQPVRQCSTRLPR